jgi:hypothetical protein
MGWFTLAVLSLGDSHFNFGIYFFNLAYNSTGWSALAVPSIQF